MAGIGDIDKLLSSYFVKQNKVFDEKIDALNSRVEAMESKKAVANLIVQNSLDNSEENGFDSSTSNDDSVLCDFVKDTCTSEKGEYLLAQSSTETLDLPWLQVDFCYEDKISRGVIPQNAKRFYYSIGGFDFHRFVDKEGSTKKPNLNWLTGDGNCDLKNLSVSSKTNWSFFVCFIGKIFDSFSLELNKFYKDIDGQRMDRNELTQFCSEFIREFPLIQSKYVAFQENCSKLKTFEAFTTTFDSSPLVWLVDKLQRKLSFTQEDDGIKKISPKSEIRTLKNKANSQARWLKTLKSPSTEPAKRRFELFLDENPNIQHPFREEMAKRQRK